MPVRIDIMMPDQRVGGASSPTLEQLRDAYQTSKRYETEAAAKADLLKLGKKEK